MRVCFIEFYNCLCEHRRCSFGRVESAGSIGNSKKCMSRSSFASRTGCEKMVFRLLAHCAFVFLTPKGQSFCSALQGCDLQLTELTLSMIASQDIMKDQCIYLDQVRCRVEL